MTYNFFRSNFLHSTVRAVVNSILWISRKWKIMPQGYMNTVICNTIQLTSFHSMYRAPWATFLLPSPRSSPAGPKFCCGVFFGKISQLSMWWNILWSDEKELASARYYQNICIKCCFRRSNISHPVWFSLFISTLSFVSSKWNENKTSFRVYTNYKLIKWF